MTTQATIKIGTYETALDRTASLDDGKYLFVFSSVGSVLAIVGADNLHSALDIAADTDLLAAISVDTDTALEYEDENPGYSYASLGGDCAYYDIESYFAYEQFDRIVQLP